MQSSTRSDSFEPQDGDEPDDVVFTNNYGVRSIELNRPTKLNSLNGSMARKIVSRLQEWTKSQLASVIVIKGAGRAFCAGGDVVAIAEQNKQGEDGQRRSAQYFALEYKLDHLIATYPKPYVAFMDGITMGGGVGLSIHAPFRIATENTLFAMPETTIGFFPDVGASFFLPRLPGGLGLYLALTSAQVRGVDVFYHGLATHYIHSSTLAALEARLAELTFPDYMTLQRRHEIVDATIEEYCSGLPEPRPAISGEWRTAIDKIFSPKKSISDILHGLEQVSKADSSYSDPIKKWAVATAESLNSRSPTSLAVVLHQLRNSREWDIAETFQREYAIAKNFMAHPDFVEGVTARLVRRQSERPNWSPATASGLSENDVAAFFEPGEGISLLTSGPDSVYKEYPHKGLGLPSEKEVMDEAADRDRQEVVQLFMEKYNGKQGVKEKVSEVLQRAQRRQKTADRKAADRSQP